MIKKSRKILPSLLLFVILLIAGGFSDGMVASAAMGENFHAPNQIINHTCTVTVLQKNVPAHNALKPCCENKQGGASAIQSSNFDQGIKFSPLDSAGSVSDSNVIFEHKISELSSASPPKPDILSSVCLKE